MDCIILAGGLGTRLRPVVTDVPKALAPIQGVPFLNLIIKELIRSGCISKITLALGYMAESVVKTFEKYPFPIDFSVEDRPLGTGGAVLKALGKTTSDSIFVVNGDTYVDALLDKMRVVHDKNQADVTIACRKTEDAARYGTLVLSDEGRVLSFKEKGCNEGIISCGLYLFKRTALEGLPFGEEFSLEHDAFPFLLCSKMYGFRTSGTFIDIGTPESFLESQDLLKAIL